MNEVTEKFAKAVREFCRWAETEPKSKIEEATVAIRLLANLYFRALALPKNGPGKDIDGNSVSDEVWEKMFQRFGSLPFNYYSDFFSPAKVAEEKPVIGDLAAIPFK